MWNITGVSLSCTFIVFSLPPLPTCFYVPKLSQKCPYTPKLGQLWDTFGTKPRPLGQFWDNFGTFLRQTWDIERCSMFPVSKPPNSRVRDVLGGPVAHRWTGHVRSGRGPKAMFELRDGRAESFDLSTNPRPPQPVPVGTTKFPWSRTAQSFPPCVGKTSRVEGGACGEVGQGGRHGYTLARARRWRSAPTLLALGQTVVVAAGEAAPRQGSSLRETSRVLVVLSPLALAKRRKGRRARENRRARSVLAIGQTGWIGAQRLAAPRPARFKRSEGRAGPHRRSRMVPAEATVLRWHDRQGDPAQDRRASPAGGPWRVLGVHRGLCWHRHREHGSPNACAHAFKLRTW